MQTTPNLGLVIPSGDGDPFDEIPFVNALTTIDGRVPNRIADITLAAPASAINFGAIPQTFRHLELIVSARTDQAATFSPLYLRFNSDAGTNYDYQRTDALAATNNPFEAFAQTVLQIGYAVGQGSGAGHWGRTRALVPDYVTFFHERMALFQSFAKVGNATGNLVSQTGGGSWRSSAAITSILLLPSGGTNFVAATHATLIGWA
jgi:hypothetical protein